MTRRERLERKIERRENWAQSAKTRADHAFARVESIASQIPLGQPILVGHHSERRARRDAERIHNGMARGVEAAKLADHHLSKADGLARQLDRSIFSDDADAIEALEKRAAEHDAVAERMVTINKAWKKSKGDAAALVTAGVISAKEAESFTRTMALCPWVKQPCDSTGARAAARRDRERIVQIKRRVERAEKAEKAGGVIIAETPEGYCSITFAEKPPREILTALKQAGFYWGGGSWGGYSEKIPARVRELAAKE
jgi:hypothetical protein